MAAESPADPGVPQAALVVGCEGAIGAALTAALRAQGQWAWVAGWSRQGGVDLTDPASVAQAAAELRTVLTERSLSLRQVWVASGFLHGPAGRPEKALSQFNAAHFLHACAVNALGPALVGQAVIPLMPAQGRNVFAALSAKVASIGDNRLGGWYSYRASKAALNQLMHTLAIEWRRRSPRSVCVSLHPGTVASPLSAPFARTGLTVRTAQESAARLLAVVGALRPEDSGGFFSYDGEPLPW